MKNKKVFSIIAFLILVASVLACGKSDATENNSSDSPANADSLAEPPASPTPRSFSATQLLQYLKANEAELSEMLTDQEIVVSGDVWSGGDRGGGAFDLEFWSPDGRIRCHGYNGDAAKLDLIKKSVADYLSKRTDKMPFVKAKGVYKKGFPPAAPPDNHWSIVLENCSVSEVIP